MVAASVDNTTIVVRDTNTGRAVTTLANVQGGAPFAYDPTGRTITAVDRQGNLVAHDLTTHAVTTLVRAPGQMEGLAYLPDGTLVYASVDHGIRYSHRGRGEPVQLSTITPLGMVATRETVVAADTKNNILIWSTSKFPRYASGDPLALAIDTTGDSLFASTDEGAQLERFDQPDPHALIPANGAKAPNELTFSPDYRFLVHPQDDTLDLYDVATGKRAATLNEFNGPITGVSFARNHRYLAVADGREDPRVVTWDLDKHRAISELPIQASLLTLAPDGQHFAALVGPDPAVTIWNAASIWDKERAGELRSKTGEPTVMSYHPDGHTLAVGHQNGTVELWDTTNYQRTAVLRGHTAALSDIQFSPDGSTLATVDQESTILLWDTTNHTQLARIDNLPAHVTSIAWRPDSHAIATGLTTGAVLTWPTDTTDAIAHLCHTLQTDFANYAAPPPPNCASLEAHHTIR